MFTGIVEAVGTVVERVPGKSLIALEIEAPELAREAGIGDSIAVNGVCLTVVRRGAGRLRFEAIPETLERSALGRLTAGSRVNLERALRADGRLDGHIVQGHVDATGVVRALERRGDDVRLGIACPAEFSAMLVEKGSVAIDGVALTVTGIEKHAFDVALIPHTLAVTTLGDLEPDTPVNLEADVLGKYVLSYLERVLPAGARDGGA